MRDYAASDAARAKNLHTWDGAKPKQLSQAAAIQGEKRKIFTRNGNPAKGMRDILHQRRQKAKGKR
jgi:hypothetical protein